MDQMKGPLTKRNAAVGSYGLDIPDGLFTPDGCEPLANDVYRGMLLKIHKEKMKELADKGKPKAKRDKLVQQATNLNSEQILKNAVISTMDKVNAQRKGKGKGKAN